MFFVPSAILAFIPNPIVSTNEAWFLSNTEKVHYLFRKICEVIDKVNTYDEMFAELKNILTDFDDTVKEAVEEYIKEMYENGELGDIIKEYVEQYLEELESELNNNYVKTNELRLNRIWRNIKTFGGLRKADTPTSNYWNWWQGCAIYKNNQGNIKISAISTDNRATLVQNARTNDTPLEKFNFNSTQAEDTLYNEHFGHGNGVCYNEDDRKLYVCNWSEYPDASSSLRVPNYYVSRVNESDYSNFEQKTFNLRSPQPIYYKGDVFENGIYGIDTDNNNFRFFKFNWQEGTVTVIKNIEKPKISGAVISAAINKDRLFIVWGSSSGSTSVIVYNIKGETMRIEWTYDIPHIINRRYTIDEVESINFLDNKMYITTCGYLGLVDQSQYTIKQIFECDIYHNQVNDVLYSYYDRSCRELVYYVDGDVSNSVVNPDGTSSNPYKYLQEAVSAVSNLQNDSISVTIRLTSDNLGFTHFIGRNNVIITNTDLDGNTVTTNRYIGGFEARGYNIKFNGYFIFKNSLATNYSDNSSPHYNAICTVNNAKVTFDANCDFSLVESEGYYASTYSVENTGGIVTSVNAISDKHAINGGVFLTQ